MKRLAVLLLLAVVPACKTNTVYSYHNISFEGMGAIEMWAPSVPDENGTLQWPKVNIEPANGRVIKGLKVTFWHDTLPDEIPQDHEVQVRRMIHMLPADAGQLEEHPMHLPEGVSAYGEWRYRVEVDFGDGIYLGQTIPVTFTE